MMASESQDFQEEQHQATGSAKGGAGRKRKLAVGDAEERLNGFDRTPGWHKKKKVAQHLNSWVCQFFC